MNQIKQENRAKERAANPRLYAILDVVKMRTFRFLEASHNYTSLRIQIEGFRDPISKSVDKEDVRACRAGEISKEEIVAKYFSAEIDVALAKRLRRLSGVKLSAEMKKIENTMFFRLPPILNLSSSLNIGAGSRAGENPNVRHKSREEILRELVDQGYNVNRYSL